MEINALMMDTTDNVVTCVTEVPAGSPAVYRKGDEICSVVAKENIPYCHKIALTDIPGRRLGSGPQSVQRATGLRQRAGAC